MCGIAGFTDRRSSLSTEGRDALLGRMCASIVHRGPDGEGRLVRGAGALGMRRLAVIDLEGGRQPMFDCSGRRAVVFNGEIYNYRDLRADLEARGHVFTSNSDTEVIIHGFEEFGTGVVHRLRGMFAFGVYDLESESVFLARDRVGEKPLFYAMTPQGDLVFGSELKVLLEHPGVPRDIDPAALDAFLNFGYVPEEFCIFKSVRKLPPGHWLEFSAGEVKLERYWSFGSVVARDGDERETAELLREKIREAVAVRLVSDVPIGAFLSGGVDSSTVVAMMSALTNGRVKTFSIGFEEDSHDELRFARLAAERFGTEHHEFIVKPEMVDCVDGLVAHFDEPFADSSALPTFAVSKLAREHVTVVLSGDGGDELFGGYTRYAVERKRRVFGLVPEAVRKGLMRPLSGVLPHGAPGRNFLYNVSLDPIDRYLDNISMFGDLNRNRLYSDGYRASLNGELGAARGVYRSIARTPRNADPTERLMHLDSRTYLPSDILVKVDRMTMAASLEARVPFLDHELIEFVETIPSNLKMKGVQGKHILKRAMHGEVPGEILHRAKQGFGVPINEWINARLKERMLGTLREPRTRQRGYFQARYIETLIDEHARGRRDHSHQLWALWMLELWHRKHEKGS